jgi:hypothetical protein
MDVNTTKAANPTFFYSKININKPVAKPGSAPAVVLMVLEKVMMEILLSFYLALQVQEICQSVI